MANPARQALTMTGVLMLTNAVIIRNLYDWTWVRFFSYAVIAIVSLIIIVSLILMIVSKVQLSPMEVFASILLGFSAWIIWAVNENLGIWIYILAISPIVVLGLCNHFMKTDGN